MFDQFSILSASPETFLSIDDSGLIESRPIKGTRARGNDVDEDLRLREDLAVSAKDRAENLMIVDLVRHDLNHVCRPAACMFRTFSRSKVFPLCISWFRQYAGSWRPVYQLSKLSGPVSLGVDDRRSEKRTMEIIDTLETSARGVYAGALGWISFSGGAELSVVIRTAVLKITGLSLVSAAPSSRIPIRTRTRRDPVKASVPYYSFVAGSEQ